MLNNKQVSQRFEVQISTLYNWSKSKPKLYRYLKNADYNFECDKEMNSVLKRFAKDIHADFSVKEISFFIESGVKSVSISIDELENLERIFIVRKHKSLYEHGDILFSIYDKLKALNIVEKYIFYKRIHNFRKTKMKIAPLVIKEYFREFMVAS